MRERGIIFNSEMVRAILDGRKTQTRRLKGLTQVNTEPDRYGGAMWLPNYGHWSLERWNAAHDVVCSHVELKCPYGQVGDLLYVREKLLVSASERLEYAADGAYLYPSNETERRWIWGRRVHRAIPSIHMPKWATRIWLEITSDRLERVQEITYLDAVAEGWPDADKYSRFTTEYKPIRWFQDLWHAINAHRPGCAWQDNPWVWVIEFKLRIEK